MSEIESIIGMRPLTYITRHFSEHEPLIPAHIHNWNEKILVFLFILTKIIENKIPTKETFLRLNQYQSKLLKQLWTRWKEQYSLNLSSIHKFKIPESHKNVNIGEVVLVDMVQPNLN